MQLLSCSRGPLCFACGIGCMRKSWLMCARVETVVKNCIHEIFCDVGSIESSVISLVAGFATRTMRVFGSILSVVCSKWGRSFTALPMGCYVAGQAKSKKRKAQASQKHKHMPEASDDEYVDIPTREFSAKTKK